MYFLLFIIVITFTGIVTASSNGCNLLEPSPKKSALLDKVNLLSGKNFIVPGSSPKETYSVSFCVDASQKHPNASVVKIVQGLETVVGLRNETDVSGEENWRIVTFGGGDVINSSGPCNNTRWKAMIIVNCRNTIDETIHLLDPLYAGCTAVFHLDTPTICPLPPQSRWSIFLMLVVTATVCYFVIGMAYRRFVLGAQGLEQIPNYDFWRDPCGYTRDYCERRDMRRNEPWSSPSNVNDNVDEPLLRP